MKAGGVPLGIGENSTVENCIVDKNARIGKNVVIRNAANIEVSMGSEEDQTGRGKVDVLWATLAVLGRLLWESCALPVGILRFASAVA